MKIAILGGKPLIGIFTDDSVIVETGFYNGFPPRVEPSTIHGKYIPANQPRRPSGVAQARREAKKRKNRK